MDRSARVQPGLLQRIVETKRAEVRALAARAGELRERAQATSPPASFAAALARGGSVAVIAEVKRRSPSAGAIRADADLAAQAAAYQSGGAAAVSVLTDASHFGGSLADLADVGGAVQLPLLRKDFTIDPLQVWEARAAGAAAVLLIVRILPDEQLGELAALAAELGLAALVEVHDETELERALAGGFSLIGINNRDLDALTIDLATGERLAPRVPPGVTLVGESGIRTRADVERLAAAGVDAVLVGESLMRGPDPAALVRSFASVPRRGRWR